MGKESIIVLGSYGNIGTYFLDYLLDHLDENKYEIIAVGRKKEYPYSFYKGKYVNLDITKSDDFKKLPQKNILAVVDFAGILPAYQEQISPYNYVNVNITGTLNVLEYCRTCNVKRIIYTHTWADLNGYLNDNQPLKPYSNRKQIFTGDHAIYAVSKCTAVDMIECYHQMFGINNYIFRLPNVYMYSPEKYYYVNGKKQKISYRYLIEKAIKGETIELWGDETKGKDVLYVKDLCQMIYKSLFTNKKTGIYNAGTGKKTTIKEQIEGIIAVFSPSDKPSNIVYCPEKRNCDDFVMDITNITEDLDYHPQYDYLSYLEDYKKEMERNLFR